MRRDTVEISDALHQLKQLGVRVIFEQSIVQRNRLLAIL